jgi:hypothetical protein
MSAANLSHVSISFSKSLANTGEVSIILRQWFACFRHCSGVARMAKITASRTDEFLGASKGNPMKESFANSAVTAEDAHDTDHQDRGADAP